MDPPAPTCRKRVDDRWYFYGNVAVCIPYLLRSNVNLSLERCRKFSEFKEDAIEKRRGKKKTDRVTVIYISNIRGFFLSRSIPENTEIWNFSYGKRNKGGERKEASMFRVFRIVPYFPIEFTIGKLKEESSKKNIRRQQQN